MAGGVVENTSQRTVLLVTKPTPLRYRLPELVGRPQLPFTFPAGTVSGGGRFGCHPVAAPMPQRGRGYAGLTAGQSWCYTAFQLPSRADPLQ
jgi:hypothetical protein